MVRSKCKEKRVCGGRPGVGPITQLQVILYGSSEYEMYNDNWKPDDKKNALAHLKALESIEYVYALPSPLYNSLSPVCERSCCQGTRQGRRYFLWDCCDSTKLYTTDVIEG